MFCTRCNEDIPEVLLMRTDETMDHPVLTNYPIIVNRTDMLEVADEMRVSMTMRVEKRMCSEVYKVTKDG